MRDGGDKTRDHSVGGEGGRGRGGYERVEARWGNGRRRGANDGTVRAVSLQSRTARQWCRRTQRRRCHVAISVASGTDHVCRSHAASALMRLPPKAAGQVALGPQGHCGGAAGWPSHNRLCCAPGLKQRAPPFSDTALGSASVPALSSAEQAGVPRRRRASDPAEGEGDDETPTNKAHCLGTQVGGDGQMIYRNMAGQKNRSTRYRLGSRNIGVTDFFNKYELLYCRIT